MTDETYYIEPGQVVCGECRNPVVPAVPLERSDLASDSHISCDVCGARIHGYPEEAETDGDE